jgi:hypothetical protein
MGGLPPAGGKLLDLRAPWTTVTGHSSEPGYLSRLGPITPAQARHLAGLATQDPGVRWRVIVLDPQGRAVAVARPRSAPGQPAGPATGLVGQVTVTISPDSLTVPPADAARLPPALNRVLAAAHDAIARAAKQTAADTTAGRCAHTEATAAYRPTRYLWDLVTARDLTCRFRTCRQPAARCDLDHTTPFDQGGPSCACNLGGICRFHHQIKQHPGWRLDQAVPGTFIWTTPSGRRYLVQPDCHVA